MQDLRELALNGLDVGVVAAAEAALDALELLLGAPQ